MRLKRLRFILGIPALLLVLGAGGFLIWTSNPSSAMPAALFSLESDPLLDVQVEPWLVFNPKRIAPTCGLILYPGGLVDPKAYAPNARAIAQAGYLVIVPPMPLNLAILDVDVAADIIDTYPEITQWAIGGHSLGGSMAAAFSMKYPDLVEGLVLWASYPANSSDLSDSDLVVSSIYGSLDGVATPAEVLSAKPLLPADTAWILIDGGNHSQFGWYGEQDGDNPATISREAQSAKIVDATLDLLSKIEDDTE
jgi:dienelactone hydrolase